MGSWRLQSVTVIFLAVIAALFAPFPGASQRRQPLDYAQLFDKTEVMIPARDGVKLHTEIYAPKNSREPLPILFDRTPYGISGGENGFSPILNRYADLIPDGYIFVFQDIRGRYGSQGKFVMLHPLHDPTDPNGIDESTDAYDTIDWLVKNVPHNNGRVGVDGTSYPGFLVTMAMIHPHPALRAVSEQACMGDVFLGDDFFHNGAFRLSYGFEYSAGLETSKENYSFPFDRFDLYDWYLRLGPLSNANARYFHGAIPTWNDFIAHNSYDEFWKRHAVSYGLKDAAVPNLNVAGWWDQEDFYGPMTTYERLEKNGQEKSELPRGGALESWRLGERRGQFFGSHFFWQRHVYLFPPEDRGALVRLLAERQRCASAQGSVAIPNRQRYLDSLRVLASSPGANPQPLFPRKRQAIF